MFKRATDLPRVDGAQKKVLAVASAGGHWVQLRRMMPAFEGCEIVFVSTLASYHGHVGESRLYTVKDASRWNKLRLMRMAMHIAWIMLRERPDVVISTGAAPGYFCLMFGKLMKARTVWVDSMANADELSLCGERAGRHADLWLTQWPHLARPDGPQFVGAVL